VCVLRSLRIDRAYSSREYTSNPRVGDAGRLGQGRNLVRICRILLATRVPGGPLEGLKAASVTTFKLSKCIGSVDLAEASHKVTM
jgi:hypothetical protein